MSYDIKSRLSADAGSRLWVFMALCDGDIFIQVDVLDGLDKIDTVSEGALEGFTAQDEAHTAGAFVDDGRDDRVLFIGVAFAFSAAVDHTDAAAVAVEDLIAGEVDRVVIGVGEFRIDEG